MTMSLEENAGQNQNIKTDNQNLRNCGEVQMFGNWTLCFADRASRFSSCK